MKCVSEMVMIIATETAVDTFMDVGVDETTTNITFTFIW
jgi:hypothetical protein